MTPRKKIYSDRTQQISVIGLAVLATITLIGSMYLSYHGKEVPEFLGYAFLTMITGLGVPLGMNLASQIQQPSQHPQNRLD